MLLLLHEWKIPPLVKVDINDLMLARLQNETRWKIYCPSPVLLLLDAVQYTPFLVGHIEAQIEVSP